MPKHLTERQREAYERDGCLFPIRVMAADEARAVRRDVERAERVFAERGQRLRHRPHLVLTALDRLIRNDLMLDAVEDLIGPNILCWTSLFFTKEAHDPSFVSWHQDSTYWGLSEPDVVSAWVALAPSTIESGAMRIVPGTHTLDQLPHHDTFSPANLLTRGQEVAFDVDDAKAVDVVLQPGEISLHHVRLVHGSRPNRSDDRRIGFAIRYIPTHVRQLNGRDYASLVRGTDAYGHFEPERPPVSDLAPEAVALYEAANAAHNAVLYQGAEHMRG